MKKGASLFLCAALALFSLGGLSGCKKEEKPLQVLLELNGALINDTTSDSMYAGDLAKFLKEMGGPEDVEIEVVPRYDESARQSLFTRVRTEMMAGEGPDVFIIDNGDSLFLTPEKNMELGQFYPLDDYLEKAQFMDQDALTAEVMAAGRSETYGQVVLPLAYDLSVTCFRQEELPEAPAGNSWQDVVDDDTGFLQVTGSLMRALVSNGVVDGKNCLSLTFGTLANYESDHRALAFTEEELRERIDQMLEIDTNTRKNLWKLPEFFSDGVSGNFGAWNYASFCHWISDIAPENVPRASLTMLPTYCDEGGVKVSVAAWAAINANTRRPDDAFFVLDALLSRDALLNLRFYDQVAYTSVPVFEESYSQDFVRDYLRNYREKHPTEWRGVSPPLAMALSERNFEEFTRIRREITHTQFRGELTRELSTLYSDCSAISQRNPNADLDKVIHEAYSRMKIEIAE